MVTDTWERRRQEQTDNYRQTNSNKTDRTDRIINSYLKNKQTDKQKIARETKERLKTHQKKTTDRQKHSDR